MRRPKHRRCQVCNVVTARYVGTARQGPFVLKTWQRDKTAGEWLSENGTVVRCQEHAEGNR